MERKGKNLGLVTAGTYFALFLGVFSAQAEVPQQKYSFTYDSNGLLETVDGPRLDTDVIDQTTLTYLNGNLATVANALGHERTYSDYNGLGLPGKMVDEVGVETSFVYHPLGWLETVTRKAPVGSGLTDAVTTMTYDDVGQVTRIDYPSGKYVIYEYDDARRLEAIQNSLGERIEYDLDAMGNRKQIEIKEQVGGASTYRRNFQYDELSRLIKEISPYNEETTYTYNLNGQQETVTDAASQTWTRSYDALKRLEMMSDPDANNVTYDYDNLDRVIKVTDERGLETSYSYDVFDNVLTRNSPDTGITTYTYDLANNRKSKTDARGIVTTYTYDALNRLKAVVYPSSVDENISYSYDEVSHCPAELQYSTGRLTTITDQSGSTQFCYDAFGNVKQTTQAIEDKNYTVIYNANNSGQIESIVYPSGRVIGYQYDTEQRVHKVTNLEPGETLIQSLIDLVSYAPFGGMNSFTFGNGITQTIDYDLSYRVINQAEGTSTTFNRSYGYEDSYLKSITDGTPSANHQSFIYDNVGRLENADGAYGAYVYDYDQVGNRIGLTRTVNSDVTVETHTINSVSNQLDQIDRTFNSIPSGTSTFRYSLVGNLTQKVQDSVTLDFEYNSANRLTSSFSGGVENSIYVYNAFGLRAIKVSVVPAANRHFIYDQQGMLLWEGDASSGETIKEYVYLNGQAVAMLVSKQDTDKDGITDDVDVFPNDPNEWYDTDQDGIGNNADADDDGDGLEDIYDPEPLIADTYTFLSTYTHTKQPDDGLDCGYEYYYHVNGTDGSDYIDASSDSIGNPDCADEQIVNGGGGNDVIDLRADADIVFGGTGNDTFIVSSNFGSRARIGMDFEAGTDTLVFTRDSGATDMRIVRNEVGDLLVYFKHDSTDKYIQIDRFFDYNAGTLSTNHLGSITMPNGQSLSAPQIVEQMDTLSVIRDYPGFGTFANYFASYLDDDLRGQPDVVDIMLAFEGNDILDGRGSVSASPIYLTDSLKGGLGSDTYIVGDGYLFTQISNQDTDYALSTDFLKIESSKTIQDVWFFRTDTDNDNDDLAVYLLNGSDTGSCDQVYIYDWFASPESALDKIELGDRVIEAADIEWLSSLMTPIGSPTSSCYIDPIQRATLTDDIDSAWSGITGTVE